MSALTFVAALLVAPWSLPAHAVVNTTSPGATAVLDALVGEGVVTSNLSSTGAAAQFGTFSDPDAVFGIDSGIILSTGLASSITGPVNQSPTTSNNMGGNTSDPELSALLDGTPTRDVAVLEFDFVPDSANLYINYVVGSEEYLDYVNFADVFGFFINGSNCARVPGTNQPVSIGTVNNSSNAGLYNDNSGVVNPTTTYATEADGFTDVFTCEAAVNPGVVNHAKIAIADNLDNELDSWVLIEGDTFSTTCSGSFCSVADLTTTVGTPTIVPGATGTVPVTVTNAGPDPATNSLVVYRPPTQVTVDVANLPTGCTADDPSPGEISCELGTVAVGSAVVVAVPVIVDPAAPPLASLTGGLADASSRDATDTDGGEGVSSVSTGAGSADLFVVVETVPTIVPGSSGTLELRVGNNGPSQSGPVTVTYAVPAGVAFDPDGPNPNGCTAAGTIVTCAIVDHIPPGGAADVDIRLSILAVQSSTGPIPDGLISSITAAVADPVTNNDTASAAPIVDWSGDSDGDGITDLVELDRDLDGWVDHHDGDGRPDYLDVDSDNDGVPDQLEVGPDPSVPIDRDGDGVPDHLDRDSDNDGIADVAEGGHGSLDGDGDGMIDEVGSNDVDGDGLDDRVDPTPVDTDGDGVFDLQDLDSDNDGILDVVESGNRGLDADGDGRIDGVAANDGNEDGMYDDAVTGLIDLNENGVPDHLELDVDSDGVPDVVEGGNGALDADGDGVIDDVAGNDLDGDGVHDGAAVVVVDTDQDLQPDYLDLDSDGDGIPDTVEAGPVPATPLDSDGDGRADYADLDSDGDGLLDIDEAGASPPQPTDSDGDGVADFRDLDSDDDGLTDGAEVGTDPTLDTDGDGDPDHLDTTPIVEVSLEIEPVTLRAGEQGTLRIVVSNLGPSPADDVVVVFTIPAGATLADGVSGQAGLVALAVAGAPANCSQAGVQVACELGTLAVGEERSLAVTLNIPADATGLAVAGFHVLSSGFDRSPSNDTASVVIEVLAASVTAPTDLTAAPIPPASEPPSVDPTPSPPAVVEPADQPPALLALTGSSSRSTVSLALGLMLLGTAMTRSAGRQRRSVDG